MHIGDISDEGASALVAAPPPGPAGSTARATLATLAASGAVLSCVAAANILIGRVLGPGGQGQVAAATLVPTIVAYAGELGLPVAAGYFVNRRPGDRNGTVAAARYAAVLLATVLTGLAAVLILVLPIEPRVKPLGFMFCAFVPLSVVHRLHLTILQAELRLAAFNMIRVAGAVTYIGALIVYAATGTATPVMVILALLVSNGVWFSLSSHYAYSRPLWRADGRRIRELFHYGVRAHIGNVSSVDGLKVDQLVLAMFLSSSQLGLYVAAMTIIIGNRVIGTSIGAVSFPLASRGKGFQGATAPREFRRLMVLSLGLAVPVAVIEIIFSGTLIRLLFGNDFVPAAPALRVLALGSIFMNLRQPCADWLRGCGRPGTVAVSEAVGLLSMVLLSTVLWDGTILRVAWIVTVSSVLSLGALTPSVVASLSGGRSASTGAGQERLSAK